MDIRFIGTGGYADIECGNSSAILQINDKKILIDCGSSVFEKLERKNLTQSIDYVLLTHLHGDHMGSLFSLSWKHAVSGKPLKIIYPSGLKNSLEKLFSLWFCDIPNNISYHKLSDFPNIKAIDTSGSHAESHDIKSYAYIFEDDKEIVYYSGDLGDIRVSTKALRNIEKDNKEGKKIRVFHDTLFISLPGIHTSYREIEEHLGSYEVYGYHCDHRKKPKDCSMKLVAEYPELLI